MQEKSLRRLFPVAVLVFLAAATFILGCATSSEPVAAPEQMSEPQGMNEASLRRGRVLAMTECTECHRFYWPHEYSVEEWRRIIEKMRKRASLSASQTADVELYFTTMRSTIQDE